MIRFRLEEILLEKNKSKYWLSKQTGLAENNIYKICRNDSKQIKLETIEKICAALNCKVEDLIDLKI